MRRNMSICIIILFVVTIVLFSNCLYVEEGKSKLTEYYKQDETESKEMVVESNQKEEYYQYILLEKDGKVTAYYSDNVTEYLDTGIYVWQLPDSIKEKLKNGIRFQNEKELFEFLESYSS